MGNSAPKDTSGTVPASKSQKNAWKRAKKVHGPSVVACICSACGQRSNAMANTTHAFCEGIPLAYFQKAPSLKGRLQGRKGEWVTISDYAEASLVFIALRQVIDLFVWIEANITKSLVEAKVKDGDVEAKEKVGSDQGNSTQVPVTKIETFTRKRNHADRSAASQAKKAA